MLPRRRPGDEAPPSPLEVEGKRGAGEPALADTPGDVERPSDNGRPGRRALGGQVREGAPPSPPENECRPGPRAVGAVAADHVDTAAMRRGHGVVQSERQIAEAAPAIPHRVERVDSRGGRAVCGEPAEGDDPSSGDRRSDLGARDRERRVRPPARRPRLGGRRESGDGQRGAGGASHDRPATVASVSAASTRSRSGPVPTMHTADSERPLDEGRRSRGQRRAVTQGRPRRRAAPPTPAASRIRAARGGSRSGGRGTRRSRIRRGAGTPRRRGSPRNARGRQASSGSAS